VQKARSTLLSSPLSATDFALRIAFFAIAPFGIVAAAELYPVRGALIDVGLALGVFVAGEAARTWASRVRVVKWLLAEALAFEGFYRETPPKPFVYYVLYPLLFPYWIWNERARREFLMFRGYTVGSFVVLLASLAWQYVEYWQPDLTFRAFLPAVVRTILYETLLVLSLLMPIATTVVWYHSSFRRRRLVAVLLVGLASTAVSLYLVERRKDPIVSYSTRDRVRLRTAVLPGTAHKTMVAAARDAWQSLVFLPGLEGDGKVEGDPLTKARTKLEQFYKSDEAAAFDIWGSPRRHPRILVLYFEARQNKPPIWVAIDGSGKEIRDRAGLPKGALQAMRKAADGTDPILPSWPDNVDLLGTTEKRAPSKARVGSSGAASSPAAALAPSGAPHAATNAEP
jgi:hypothetical protein